MTLPLSTQVELYHQEAGLEILLLDLTDDPSDDHHLLAFFAIRHEAASKDLSAYSDNQLPQALSSISSQPEDIKVTRLGEISPGVSIILGLEEREGVLSQHLVAFRDGWVYNLMIQPLAGNQPSPEALTARQEEILLSLFAPLLSFQKQWQPVQGFSLIMPDHLLLFDAKELAPGSHSINLGLNETGVLASVCQLFVTQAPQNQAASLAILDPGQRQTLLAASILPPDEGSQVKALPGQGGIFSYQAFGMQAYAALKDGQILQGLDMPQREEQPFEGSVAQTALLSLLGEAADWPQVQRHSHASPAGGAAVDHSRGRSIPGPHPARRL